MFIESAMKRKRHDNTWDKERLRRLGYDFYYIITKFFMAEERPEQKGIETSFRYRNAKFITGADSLLKI